MSVFVKKYIKKMLGEMMQSYFTDTSGNQIKTDVSEEDTMNSYLFEKLQFNHDYFNQLDLPFKMKDSSLGKLEIIIEDILKLKNKEITKIPTCKITSLTVTLEHKLDINKIQYSVQQQLRKYIKKVYTVLLIKARKDQSQKIEDSVQKVLFIQNFLVNLNVQIKDIIFKFVQQKTTADFEAEVKIGCLELSHDGQIKQTTSNDKQKQKKQKKQVKLLENESIKKIINLANFVFRWKSKNQKSFSQIMSLDLKIMVTINQYQQKNIQIDKNRRYAYLVQLENKPNKQGQGGISIQVSKRQLSDFIMFLNVYGDNLAKIKDLIKRNQNDSNSTQGMIQQNINQNFDETFSKYVNSIITQNFENSSSSNAQINLFNQIQSKDIKRLCYSSLPLIKKKVIENKPQKSFLKSFFGSKSQPDQKDKAILQDTLDKATIQIQNSKLSGKIALKWNKISFKYKSSEGPQKLEFITEDIAYESQIYYFQNYQKNSLAFKDIEVVLNSQKIFTSKTFQHKKQKYNEGQSQTDMEKDAPKFLYEKKMQNNHLSKTCKIKFELLLKQVSIIWKIKYYFELNQLFDLPALHKEIKNEIVAQGKDSFNPTILIDEKNQLELKVTLQACQLKFEQSQNYIYIMNIQNAKISNKNNPLRYQFWLRTLKIGNRFNFQQIFVAIQKDNHQKSLSYVLQIDKQAEIYLSKQFYHITGQLVQFLNQQKSIEFDQVYKRANFQGDLGFKIGTETQFKKYYGYLKEKLYIYSQKNSKEFIDAIDVNDYKLGLNGSIIELENKENKQNNIQIQFSTQSQASEWLSQLKLETTAQNLILDYVDNSNLIKKPEYESYLNNYEVKIKISKIVINDDTSKLILDKFEAKYKRFSNIIDQNGKTEISLKLIQIKSLQILINNRRKYSLEFRLDQYATQENTENKIILRSSQRKVFTIQFINQLSISITNQGSDEASEQFNMNKEIIYQQRYYPKLKQIEIGKLNVKLKLKLQQKSKQKAKQLNSIINIQLTQFKYKKQNEIELQSLRIYIDKTSFSNQIPKKKKKLFSSKMQSYQKNSISLIVKNQIYIHIFAKQYYVYLDFLDEFLKYMNSQDKILTLNFNFNIQIQQILLQIQDDKNDKKSQLFLFKLEKFESNLLINQNLDLKVEFDNFSLKKKVSANQDQLMISLNAQQNGNKIRSDFTVVGSECDFIFAMYSCNIFYDKKYYSVKQINRLLKIEKIKIILSKFLGNNVVNSFNFNIYVKISKLQLNFQNHRKQNQSELVFLSFAQIDLFMILGQGYNKVQYTFKPKLRDWNSQQIINGQVKSQEMYTQKMITMEIQLNQINFLFYPHRFKGLRKLKDQIQLILLRQDQQTKLMQKKIDIKIKGSFNIFCYFGSTIRCFYQQAISKMNLTTEKEQQNTETIEKNISIIHGTSHFSSIYFNSSTLNWQPLLQNFKPKIQLKKEKNITQWTINIIDQFMINLSPEFLAFEELMKENVKYDVPKQLCKNHQIRHNIKNQIGYIIKILNKDTQKSIVLENDQTGSLLINNSYSNQFQIQIMNHRYKFDKVIVKSNFNIRVFTLNCQSVEAQKRFKVSIEIQIENYEKNIYIRSLKKLRKNQNGQQKIIYLKFDIDDNELQNKLKESVVSQKLFSIEHQKNCQFELRKKYRIYNFSLLPIDIINSNNQNNKIIQIDEYPSLEIQKLKKNYVIQEYWIKIDKQVVFNIYIYSLCYIYDYVGGLVYRNTKGQVIQKLNKNEQNLIAKYSLKKIDERIAIELQNSKNSTFKEQNQNITVQNDQYQYNYIISQSYLSFKQTIHQDIDIKKELRNKLIKIINISYRFIIINGTKQTLLIRQQGDTERIIKIYKDQKKPYHQFAKQNKYFYIQISIQGQQSYSKPISIQQDYEQFEIADTSHKAKKLSLKRQITKDAIFIHINQFYEKIKIINSIRSLQFNNITLKQRNQFLLDQIKQSQIQIYNDGQAGQKKYIRINIQIQMQKGKLDSIGLPKAYYSCKKIKNITYLYFSQQDRIQFNLSINSSIFSFNYYDYQQGKRKALFACKFWNMHYKLQDKDSNQIALFKIGRVRAQNLTEVNPYYIVLFDSIDAKQAGSTPIFESICQSIKHPFCNQIMAIKLYSLKIGQSMINLDTRYIYKFFQSETRLKNNNKNQQLSHELMMKETPNFGLKSIVCEKLILQKLNIDMNFKVTSSWCQNIIKNMSLVGYKIRIKQQTFPSIRIMQSNELIFQGLQKYIISIMNTSFKILGYISIFGSPVNFTSKIHKIVHNLLIKMPKKGFQDNGLKGIGSGIVKGADELLKGTLEQTFEAIEIATNSFGQGFTALAKCDKQFIQSRRQIILQRPSNAAQGLKSGGKVLFNGIKSGVTGVLLQPIEGAQKDGFSGFLSGVVKGIGWLAIKPVSGIIDATSKTAEGIKNSYSLCTEDGRNIRKRLCKPRPFYNLLQEIKVYSWQMADLNQHLLMEDQQKFSQMRWIDVLQVNQRQYLLFSIEYIVLFRKNPFKIEQCKQFDSVFYCKKDQNKISILLHKQEANQTIMEFISNQPQNHFKKIRDICEIYLA